MRAVVTGGAGFLGSHLAETLIHLGWKVIVIDDLSSGDIENLNGFNTHRDFQFIESDIRKGISLPGPVDLVLNFASPASPRHFIERPLDTLESGSIGIHAAITFAALKGARLIQASTSEVYGEPRVHPQPESYWGNVNPIGIRSVYDESKRYAEAAIAAHVRLGELGAGIIRIFNTYGPRLQPSDGRVISNFIYQSLNNIPLTVYGSGAQTRSFCYVDDLIQGIILFATQAKSFGPMNLGNPNETTILELAKAVIRLTGARSALNHCPLPIDDPTQRRPDISLAEKTLNWQPHVDLTEGLAQTIKWFTQSMTSRTQLPRPVPAEGPSQ